MLYLRELLETVLSTDKHWIEVSISICFIRRSQTFPESYYLKTKMDSRILKWKLLTFWGNLIFVILILQYATILEWAQGETVTFWPFLIVKWSFLGMFFRIILKNSCYNNNQNILRYSTSILFLASKIARFYL